MSPAVFTLIIFQVRSHAFCLDLVSDFDPTVYASQGDGATAVHHHVCLVCWDGLSLHFCPGWPWSMILLISNAWVAGITGMHHGTWPELTFNILWAPSILTIMGCGEVLCWSCLFVVWNPPILGCLYLSLDWGDFVTQFHFVFPMPLAYVLAYSFSPQILRISLFITSWNLWNLWSWLLVCSYFDNNGCLNTVISQPCLQPLTFFLLCNASPWVFLWLHLLSFLFLRFLICFPQNLIAEFLLIQAMNSSLLHSSIYLNPLWDHW
jgi:hypothetical protein